MSMDVLGPNERLQPYGRGARSALTGRERTTITDLVVIFGGWGGIGNGGGPLNPNVHPPTGTSQLLKKVLRLTPTPGRRLRVLGYEGALMFGSNEPFQILLSIFHPLMKIIFYGYSAGGENANVLAWQVWQNMRYYDFANRRFYSYLGADAFRRSTIGITRVDLLITVDAAVGPGSSVMFRNVAPSVRRNVNYYQVYPSSSVGSHGGPSTPLWSYATRVENRNLSSRYRNRQGQAHGLIDNDTMDNAYQFIRGALGIEAVPPLAPPGTAFG